MSRSNGPSPGFVWTLLFIAASAIAVYAIAHITEAAKGMLW